MDNMKEDLKKWYSLQEEISGLKAQEMELRKKIFNDRFPKPKEGVNTTPLDDGYVLKATHKISREIDQAAFPLLRDNLIHLHNINVDKLVQTKYSLVLSAYNSMDADLRHIFDNALIIKHATPSLEIVKPKKGLN